MATSIPARIVVSEHKTYGLQVRTEVQVPGTSLWLPVRAVPFKNGAGEMCAYMAVNGQSLKRFVCSLDAEPTAARVDTADTSDECSI